MTAISYATAIDPRALPFKDRRTSLTVMGVLLILLGALCSCFGVVAPAGMLMVELFGKPAPATQGARPLPTSDPDYRTIVLAGATYLLMAVPLIWAGIGSVRRRRWVRPVMIVMSWTWLLTGLVSCVHWFLSGVNVRDMMMASGPPVQQPPQVVVTVVTAVMGVLTLLIAVALPASLAWGYQRRGVRETLDYFDPRAAWTDRCPTPVLAVGAWLVLAAVGCFVYSIYAVLPVFGRFVTGPAAVAALLTLGAAFLWLAQAVYRLRSWAWWATAILWTVWGGSMVWTFTSAGYHEFYRRAGYSPQDVDVLMQYSGQFEDGTVWTLALWSVALLGYLLYVRKYFDAGPLTEPGMPPAPVPSTAVEVGSTPATR